MRDTITNGLKAGLLATVADVFIHWFAYFILGTSTTAHYIYQLIFPFQEPNLIRLTIGMITHFAAGAIVGVLLAFIIKLFGQDYIFVKALGLGVAFWIVHVAVIPNLVAPRPYVFRSELESIVDLIAHLAYGAVAALYLKRLYRVKMH